MNLTPDQLRAILGIPEDEPVDRPMRFMRLWQEMRVGRKWGTLTLKFQAGKEVHGEQNSPF